MNKVFVCFVFAVICLISEASVPNEVGHPIAIVPGILGTALFAEAKDIPKSEIPSFCPRNHKEFQIWVNLGFDFNAKCFRHYMKMNYTNGEWVGMHGVTIKVPKEGTTYSVDILDAESTKVVKYFHNLIKALEGHGYKDGENMVACGYDWRHLPTDEWTKKCHASIEKMVKATGKKAILIGHSMGGPFSYHVLRSAGDDWVKQYIFKYITAAPAWMGAPRALDAMFTGLGAMIPAPLSNLFAPLSRSVPAVWFLLPWSKAFNSDYGIFTPANHYTYDQIPKVLEMAGLDDTEAKYKSARKLFESYGNYDKVPPVPIISAYGNDIDTIVSLRFKEEIKKHDPDEDWKHPSHIYGPGDNTVPEISLRFATDKWKAMEPKHNITIVHTSGLNHHHVVMEAPFINLVIDEAFHDYN